MSKPVSAPDPTFVASVGVPAMAGAEVSDHAAFVTASHEALFEVDEPAQCDACGAPLPDEGDEHGYGVVGSGVYLWTRGDSVRFETAPLCASCASAIGMTALARWEIEEEEG